MTFSFKHIGLLIGFSLITISFLFFGTRQHTYVLLLISGLILSLIFYLAILSGKEQLKSKVIWNIVVIVYFIVQHVAEPFLIDSSYNSYISEHTSVLKEINNILENKQGNITILGDSIINKSDRLTAFEQRTLLGAEKELGVYFISKTDKKIYYGLGGFLDVRIGLTYWSDKVKPLDTYRHLSDNWFF